MVNFVLSAVDSKDPYPRKWAVWADVQPAVNWYTLYGLVNDVPVQLSENRYSGDSLSGEVDLPDGVHTIYAGISMDGDPNANGTYSGSINVDGIVQQFSGFTATVLGGWQINVLNNKAVSFVKAPGSQSGGTGFMSKLTNIWNKTVVAVKDAANTDFVTHNWPWITIGVGLPIVGAGTVYYLKKKRRI